MIELSRTRYDRVSRIFHGIDHNRAMVFSVTEGNRPGSIYVDNAEKPRTAFVYGHDVPYFYFGGDCSNTQFNQSVTKHLFDEILPSKPELEAVIFSFSDEWRDELDSLFADKGVIRIARKVFRFDREAFEKHCSLRSELPNELKVRRIDENFADRCFLYGQFGGTQASRFGFCITRNDTVISECVSVCVGANEAEVAIETKEEYRGKGFGRLVASAFIEHSLELGITPNWACWPNRKASYQLAKRLGFKELPDVPAHFWGG